MTVDQGLLALGGIGKGLSSFMDSFQSAQAAERENKLKNAQLGLLAQKQGADFDPTTGLLSPNDLGKAQRESDLQSAKLSTAKSQQGLSELNEARDPNSDFSTANNALGSALGGYLKKKGTKGEYDDIAATLSDPNVSPRTKQLLAEHPAMKELLAGAKNDTDFARYLAVANKRNEGASDRADQKKTVTDQKLEDEFKKALVKNEGYKEADTAANSADGLINLVNNATKNKTSAASLPTELANFASKGKRLHTATVDAFANPNSDLMSRIQTGISKSTSGTIPPQVAKDIIQYLSGEKQSASQQRATVLKAEAEDFNKINGRYPKLYQPEAQGLLPQNGGAAVDSAAVQWAKANPNDPRAVKIMQVNGAQ